MQLQFLLAGFVFLTALSHTTIAETVTFSQFKHGFVLDNQTYDNGDGDVFHGIPGATISVYKFGSTNNLVSTLGVIFDSRELNTQDPDLEDPFVNGNTAKDGFGNMLIVQEGDNLSVTNGVLDGEPDDQGPRPSGLIIVEFNNPITSVGFDIIDIENDNDAKDSGILAANDVNDILNYDFGTTNDAMLKTFNEMQANGNPQGLQFGNRSANRIAPLSATDFGLASGSSFSTIAFYFNDSGAIDNIVTTASASAVPEPASWLLLCIGGGFCVWRRRACPGKAA